MRNIAYLFKKVLDNDNQEIRYMNSSKMLVHFKKVNNVRASSEMAISNFKAKKFTALYRFYTYIYDTTASEIELDDKIEIDDVKYKVTYIEQLSNETGKFNKVYLIGLC